MHELKKQESLSGDSISIKIRSLGKTFQSRDRGEVFAIRDVSLEIKEKEFLSIVGPSGCGKSTLLNLISGLLRPSYGEIQLFGNPITGPSRQIGIVFQQPVLLPWRNVIDNVLLPVEVMHLQPYQKYLEKARELIELVGLSGFEKAYPKELSGGMQQRVAIVRALIYDSKILLMDEPFGALDAMTREELNLELLRIWQMTKRTIVFVTHSIQEAVLLSDRIIVMSQRPAIIVDILNVDFPRPRDHSLFEDVRFGQMSNRVRQLLGSN